MFLFAVNERFLSVDATAAPMVERSVAGATCSPSSYIVALWALRSKPTNDVVRPLDR